MDPNHVVGPMESRREANEVWIFHVPKSAFNMMLSAVAKDNLLMGEFVEVGEEDSFAQHTPLQLLVSLFVGSELHDQPALLIPRNFRPDKLTDILTVGEGFQSSRQTFLGIGLSLATRLMASLEALLKFVEDSEFFREMLADASYLSVQ